MKTVTKKTAEAGFSLLTVIITSAVVMTMAAGTVQVLNKKVEAMKILRMQQRMDLFQQKVENTASSFGAMSKSATLNPGSILQNCMTSSSCNGQDLFQAFNLYDSLGQKVSGLFDLSGRPCQDSCPIEIRTELKLLCDGGAASCSQPMEVQTRYTIRQNNSEIFNGRSFDPITGIASLVTFACPTGQYIVAVTAEGIIRCDSPMASPNDETCPSGTAAFGLDKQGYLKCMPIDDYCAKPLGLSAVLDTSGSMNSNGKLSAAKAVMSAFLGDMDAAKDQGALTIFNSGAQIKQPLNKDFNKIKLAINSERADGATNMSAGIEQGAKAVASYSAGPKIMFLISDGFHNRGGVDPVTAAAVAKSDGIRILTVGFSKDADSNMLRKIASTPSDYFDAATGDDLKKVFESIGVMTCRGPVKDYGKAKDDEDEKKKKGKDKD